MSLETGTTLGSYSVTAKIGEGGMGEVWEATDTKLNRQVARHAFGFVARRRARPVKSLRVTLQQLVGHPLFVALFVTSFLVGCSETSTRDNTDVPRGLRFDTAEATDAYVLFSPLLSDTTYLIATATGEVVHTWKSDYAPSGFVYLLDNGHLLRGGREPEVATFTGGGQGGRIQRFTWDGELSWDFVFATEDHLLHHDVEVLPNGNVLAIAWERRTAAETRHAGRRPEMIPEGGVWPDMVLEFEPQSPDEARIVWEWHMWDHTIQDLDPSLANHGVPSEHPELIDINGDRNPPERSEEEATRFRDLGYVPADVEDAPPADFMHTNAVAYNAALDQIALSIPGYNELWIIDHSTTTTEAAGSTGGRWGHGGDVLYRWGNPRSYGRGWDADRRLGGQHDVRWVPEGLSGAGNILVYNNNVTGPEGTYSAVFEISPPTDEEGNYVVPRTDAFGPVTPAWTYAAADKTSFYSPFISGAHRLPGGHTLITSGAQGRFFEVTAVGEIVWEHWTPYSGHVRMPDGSPPHPVGEFPYAVFRATKISPDHPALGGRTLAPLEPQPAILPPPEL